MADGHDTDETKLDDDTALKVDQAVDDAKDVNVVSEENQMPSKQQEEEIIKKKYGGLLPKKPPLISKDSDRAFFDSADWALGKKSKGPLEALRPKLQPTPHPQVRSRSAYAPADGTGEDGCNGDDNSDNGDQSPGENQGNGLEGRTDECNNCHCSDSQNQQMN